PGVQRLAAGVGERLADDLGAFDDARLDVLGRRLASRDDRFADRPRRLGGSGDCDRGSRRLAAALLLGDRRRGPRRLGATLILGNQWPGLTAAGLGALEIQRIKALEIARVAALEIPRIDALEIRA